ncbi:MAG TPA: hypothetical protein VNO50_21130 [Pyrinomonadaceae bacterium]|nr:hypothetical protein [Pyrinomonadaceae bacterium]
MAQEVKRKVEWFHRNLELQLEDLYREDEGALIKTYFDTADVRCAVLGAQSFYDRESFDELGFQSARTLVRCLATSGWLGTIEMLPPHQAEFLTLMDINFNLSEENDDKYGRRFLEDVKALIGRGTEESQFERISEGLTEDQLMEFVRDMRQQAESAEVYFKALESIGPWEPRLGRWLREQTLFIESEKFNFGGMVTTPAFQSLKSAFDSKRRSPSSSLNNFADAMAISILVDRVATFQKDAQELPRFFVPSRLFLDVINEARVSHQLFSEKPSTGEIPSEGIFSSKSVFRNADYFIFKAIFRPHSGRVGIASDSDPIDVRGLHAVVKDILKTQGDLNEATIRSIDISGRPLVEIIDEVKEFSFLKNIWLQFIEVNHVRRVIDLQKQVRDLVQVEEVMKAVEATKDAIYESATEYRRVRTLWRDLDQATSNLKIRIADDPSKPVDVFRDLGLLRFGFPAESHNAIQQVVEPMFKGGKNEQIAARNIVLRACYSERSRISRPEVVHNLIQAGAVMWLTRLDNQLFKLLDGLLQTGPLPHFSLDLLYAATAFRSTRQIRKGQDMLDKLVLEYERLSYEDHIKRAELAVGLGYLFFHLWWGLGYRPAWFPPSDDAKRDKLDAGIGILNKAITFAKRAYDSAGKNDSSKRVYALNQYLYYLVMGGGDDRLVEIENAAANLVSYKADNELWQYRFDDTMARYFHRLATRSRNPDRWAKLMGDARRHLERAHDFARWDEQVEFYSTVFALDETLGFGRMGIQAIKRP